MYGLLYLTGESTGTNLISSDITTAITGSGSDILASVTGVLGVVVPAALGIMGLVMAVKIGIRLFKSLTKSGANG